nr:L-lactate permease [Opitutaceae bacterium]
MNWTQNYTPFLDSLFASTLVALAPVVILLGLLAFFHVRAHWAALAGLLTVLLSAIFIYHMPAELAVAASIYG